MCVAQPALHGGQHLRIVLATHVADDGQIRRRLEVLGTEALQAAYPPAFQRWAHRRVEGDVATRHCVAEFDQQASQCAHDRSGDRYDVDMHELIHPPELMDACSMAVLLA